MTNHYFIFKIQSFNHTIHPTQLQCTKFQENTIIQLSFTHVTNSHFTKQVLPKELNIEKDQKCCILEIENEKHKYNSRPKSLIVMGCQD
jgi:hypothetical protein